MKSEWVLVFGRLCGGVGFRPAVWGCWFSAGCVGVLVFGRLCGGVGFRPAVWGFWVLKRGGLGDMGK
ncbi:MAG: hypothetical protein ACYS30_10785, partial [Planctomycetota bacterium]